ANTSEPLPVLTCAATPPNRPLGPERCRPEPPEPEPSPFTGMGAASTTATPPEPDPDRSANSGAVESLIQSEKPSFQTYVSALISPRSSFARISVSGTGPTCSPSTTRCHPPSAVAAGAAAASLVPRTTMMWLHFLHRILK